MTSRAAVLITFPGACFVHVCCDHAGGMSLPSQPICMLCLGSKCCVGTGFSPVSSLGVAWLRWQCVYSHVGMQLLLLVHVTCLYVRVCVWTAREPCVFV